MPTIHPGTLLTYLALGVSSLWLACTTSQPPDEQALAQADSAAARQVPTVQVAPAIRRAFATQVVSNGHVLTSQEAQLYFRTAGVIERVYVRNGAAVKAGQLLASLHNAAPQLALREAELQLAESQVEINDLLITQGGRRGDTSSVSPEVYGYIKLRSGYNRARMAVEKARLELESTYLRAPTDGLIANLSVSAHNPTPTDKPFCTLINRAEVLVRCPILETELATVQPGQTARVEPMGLPGLRFRGRVTDINPVVDSQGLVEVTLRLLDATSRLLSGMNVRVVLEKAHPNQLVVPKTAVVDRSGRKVVFTHENGLAKWHYVTLGLENDTEVTITEGLEAGQEVIVAGNLNLGHDARVEVLNRERP